MFSKAFLKYVKNDFLKRGTCLQKEVFKKKKKEKNVFMKHFYHVKDVF